MKIRVRSNLKKPITGICRVPGDKSVSHRSLLFGALTSGGKTRVSGLGTGDDNRSTRQIMEQLGATITDVSADEVEIVGVGLHGLHSPTKPLDCGNSGTSMRLLAGLLSAQPFDSIMVGDDSLSGRPMMRVCGPLRKMGAELSGQPGKKAGEVYPPLHIQGGQKLTGFSYSSPIASAQVKSAVLIAGLYAEGRTEVMEPGPSRDHTERMLSYFGVDVAVNGRSASLAGGVKSLQARPLLVPGDPSSAAFVVAGALLAGDNVAIENVSTNQTRTGFLDVLSQMGAGITLENEKREQVEPTATIAVAGKKGVLRGTTVSGELVVRAIDELPILAVVASAAEGITHFRDAAELRVKESDRIDSVVSMLRAFGVEVEERADGFSVQGKNREPLDATRVDSHGDHRIAMSAVVAGLMANGETVVENVSSIATSFPTFVDTFRLLGADLELQQG